MPIDDTVVVDVLAPDSLAGAREALSRLVDRAGTANREQAPVLTVRLPDGVDTPLPEALSRAVLLIAREALAGHHVEIVVADDEIGMETLAHLLGVSRPTAAQLVDEGAIPSHRTAGGHRRVRLSDAARLRERWTRQRAAIAEHVAHGEEHDFPLGPPPRRIRGA